MHGGDGVVVDAAHRTREAHVVGGAAAAVVTAHAVTVTAASTLLRLGATVGADVVLLGDDRLDLEVLVRLQHSVAQHVGGDVVIGKHEGQRARDADRTAGAGLGLA